MSNFGDGWNYVKNADDGYQLGENTAAFLVGGLNALTGGYLMQDGNVQNGNIPSPIGNTYRGPFSTIFNQAGIAAEDWQRQIQANDIANDFAATEAQKQRDFEERLANTQYQRMVTDMKKAGINPIMAFSSGGAAVPSGAAASPQSGGTTPHKQTDVLADLVKIFAGALVTKSLSGKGGSFVSPSKSTTVNNYIVKEGKIPRKVK